TAAARIHGGIRQVEIDVVEHIERLELELQLEAFSECEGFEHGRIGVEEQRSSERVEANISELIASRLTPWTRRNGCWGSSCGAHRAIQLNAIGGFEPVAGSSGVSRTGSTLHGSHQVGHARTIVDLRSAGG